jgi:two-component system invasion response regulator UvrY
MNAIKVLVADDHTMIAQMWGAFLSTGTRYDVIDKVNNCKDLQETVMLQQPDVVLLDISLADGSSLDILPAISKQSPHTKFLVVSAYADTATVQKSFAAGAHGYLTKTSTLEEMEEAITSVREGNQYQCREIMDLMTQASAEAHTENTKIAGKSLLTRKEKEVAYLVYKGLSAKDIAEKLGVSFKTVEVHRHHIYQKLGIQKASRLMLYVKDNQHLFSDVLLDD